MKASQTMLDIVRERILRAREEEMRRQVVQTLEDAPFAVRNSYGRWVDPLRLDHEGLTKQQWKAMLKETFADFHDRQRVAEFVRGWASLDQDARNDIVDENADRFVPGRVRWLHALSDRECEHLKSSEPWEVFHHLSSNEPIFGVREVNETEMDYAPAPRPSFARAA